jgi:hypothetical protein
MGFIGRPSKPIFARGVLFLRNEGERHRVWGGEESGYYMRRIDVI